MKIPHCIYIVTTEQIVGELPLIQVAVAAFKPDLWIAKENKTHGMSSGKQGHSLLLLRAHVDTQHTAMRRDVVIR